MGPLTSLFWTFGDVCPGFQNQDGSPLLCALSPECNRFLRFTSDATPADLLTASIAPQPSGNSHQTSNSLCVKFSGTQWSCQTKTYHGNIKKFCVFLFPQLTQQRIKCFQTAKYLRFNEAHWLHTELALFPVSVKLVLMSIVNDLKTKRTQKKERSS